MSHEVESSTPASMQVIADRLNLSVATISRALNGVPGIRAATRARVMKAAAEVGYPLPSGNRAGMGRRDQLTHVGVLIPMHPGTPAPLYLVGMCTAAAELHVSLAVHCVRTENCERLLDPKFRPVAMNTKLLSGLILLFRWPLPVVRALSNQLPIVSIIHRYDDVPADFIGIDDRLGIDMLFRHLQKLGHARIGFLGRSAELHWAASRFAAYVSALTGSGFDYNPDWAISVSQENLTDVFRPLDASVEQVAQLMTKQKVRAWICSSEGLARQLHNGLTKRGFRVPQDVSITGFHRPARQDPEGLELTSVTVSYEALGAAALRRLVYHIQNPTEPPRNVLFAPEFYDGKTCAEPPWQEIGGGPAVLGK